MRISDDDKMITVTNHLDLYKMISPSNTLIKTWFDHQACGLRWFNDSTTKTWWLSNKRTRVGLEDDVNGRHASTFLNSWTNQELGFQMIQTKTMIIELGWI